MIANTYKALQTLITITKATIEPKLASLIIDKMTSEEAFITAPGSKGSHHAYIGGLVIHTAEVVKYALIMVTMFPKADTLVLLIAAIFHDYMKIKEYVYGTDESIATTQYRHLIRHVAGSYAEIYKLFDTWNIPEEKRIQIGHAMLAHHGKFEWGSPVEPQTVEAYILHCADMFSMQYGPESAKPLMIMQQSDSDINP